MTVINYYHSSKPEYCPLSNQVIIKRKYPKWFVLQRLDSQRSLYGLMQITFCIYNIYISYLLQVARASLRNKTAWICEFCEWQICPATAGYSGRAQTCDVVPWGASIWPMKWKPCSINKYQTLTTLQKTHHDRATLCIIDGRENINP